MAQIREVLFFKDYFLEFYEEQPIPVQKKIDWTIDVVRQFQMVPEKYLQFMEGTNGLFEMRSGFGGRIFRVFCCFDEGNLVILFNGFEKKSQKTPGRELKRAIRIHKEYLNEKQKGKIADFLRRAP